MTAAVLPPPFRCDVQPDRDRVVVRPAGEVDLFEAPVLNRLSNGFERIVVDLRLLSFMDSMGVELLLAIRERAHEHGAALALVRGPWQVERLFELTATASLFAFEDPEEVG